MNGHQKISIFWFRKDLRLRDHQVFSSLQGAEALLPIYIHDLENEGKWKTGAASQWFLHHSLKNLDKSLQAFQSKLSFFHGNSLEVFKFLVRKFSVQSVQWSRSYESHQLKIEAEVEDFLVRSGIEVKILPGNLISEPGSITKSDKNPYVVYTPFWRAFVDSYKTYTELKFSAPPPLPPLNEKLGVNCEELNLLPKIKWDTEFYQNWIPSEEEAHKRLDNFLKSNLLEYSKNRDYPGLQATSSLSPYLHFGLIHPRSILRKIEKMHGPLKKISNKNIIQFCKELVWREFSHHVMHYHPQVPDESIRIIFNQFPWKTNLTHLKAWQKGKTGYPIVDAGMRQLWRTGWMHNRVRMIVASFLTKDLHIHWLEGARWFWDTLVDADLANNSQGWQWTAGCGFDAAPYFRIFNPITQSETFDPEGSYIRTWCPELSLLPNEWIHKPWLAPEQVLKRARVNLSHDYPLPIVDHKEARDYSLAAYKGLRV